MFNDLLLLLFPKTCNACNIFLTLNEKVICTSCRNELPVTNSEQFTSKNLTFPFKETNIVSNFSSLFYFKKNSGVQELLHNLKYRGYVNLGKFIGDWHSAKLIESDNFKNIDLIIPMPIHKRRLRKRGYNQVSQYAKAIAEKLHATYRNDILIKSKHKRSQVFLNREERFKNILDSLYLKNVGDLEGKHVLILDDIITTGATMKACISILKDKASKISVASIALVVDETY